MNDHKVKIVGISDASAPFLSNPVIHNTYSEAVNFIGRERTQLFLRAGATAARPITRRGLPANEDKPAYVRAQQINSADCILYYLKNTGIPVISV